MLAVHVLSVKWKGWEEIELSLLEVDDPVYNFASALLYIGYNRGEWEFEFLWYRIFSWLVSVFYD